MTRGEDFDSGRKLFSGDFDSGRGLGLWEGIFDSGRGETVERGDVVVFNNQWPHKAPTEEYRDEHNKRSDEWKNKVSKYGRRWVYVSWRNKTNKVNAMQEAVHVNSVEALFEQQYNEDASEPDEERQAKKAKKE